MLDFLRFFSGLFICRPALPCFLPVLGGAGGGAGPLPPSSLSGGGGAEAAMDWGTRVSVGGGWKRPQAAPSPGGESGAAQHPRAAASPRHAERESQSQSTNCTPAPDSPPAHGHSNRNRNSNGSPPPSAVGRGKMGRAKTLHPGRLGLATPLLRSAAEAGRAGPAAVGCTARQRARELPNPPAGWRWL